jgi:uncharacterized protein YeaO (DUF488 family)
MLKLKRAYEPADSADGERILVERLWPRGVTKEEARLSAWMKDIAPSTALRKWYGHVVARWPEFQRRYEQELQLPEKQQMLQELADKARTGTVTMVYGARDTEHNGAIVLKEYLDRHFRDGSLDGREANT